MMYSIKCLLYRFLIYHPHSIGSDELGQIGNEAALSHFIYVGGDAR